MDDIESTVWNREIIAVTVVCIVECTFIDARIEHASTCPNQGTDERKKGSGIVPCADLKYGIC